MPPTLLAVAAFAAALWIEKRRAAAMLGDDFRPPDPLPSGRWRWPLLLGALLVLAVALALPAFRHLESAAGVHFGPPVAAGGARPQLVTDDARGRPASLADGLRRGLTHDGIGASALLSIELAGVGALLALLAALVLVEAGRASRRLDRLLLVLCFLPIAVPPMSFAVGFVRLWGASRTSATLFPALLLAGRLLPFAAFAVRAARLRLSPTLLEAGAVAGLSPLARYLRLTLPLMAPGAGLGFLLAFLFGLREVDALVFTKSGAETLPVKLYAMIHYGYDVQVAGLAFLWMVAVALFLLLLLLLLPRLRLLP
jgi:ABC-type Fe3+ transport system permease subunit